jgi:hypothetical protein
MRVESFQAFRSCKAVHRKVTLFLGLVFEVPIPVAGGAELDNTPTATKASVASPMPSKEPSPQRRVAELKKEINTSHGTTSQLMKSHVSLIMAATAH